LLDGGVITAALPPDALQFIGGFVEGTIRHFEQSAAFGAIVEDFIDGVAGPALRIETDQFGVCQWFILSWVHFIV
ncbi:MAG TPA: hypothetical protein VER03_00945, partial [Bryobacteraceae bacterium]|nr:hypothetical protein [Bryobacteraceae bacterium]